MIRQKDFIDSTIEYWAYKNPVKADHIRVKRIGGLYAHHGIYISDNEVIHFTGQDDDSILDWSKCEVIQSDLKQFLKDGILEVKEYTDEEFEDLYSPEQIVIYARSCIGDKGYNLAFNNCEHFANVCTLGRFRSQQVERVLMGKMPNEEENRNMGIFGSVGNAIKSFFGGGSRGGSRSTSNTTTTYEPDKVKIAEIESDTKIRLANKELERIEAMKQARIDLLEFETQSQIALEQAKAQGLAAMAQTIVALQEKLNEVAEKRLQIIEKSSLQIIREMEGFYKEIGEQIERDDYEYTSKKLPALLDILNKYDSNSAMYKIYEKKILQDMDLQQQHYLKQMEAVTTRQAQVLNNFLSGKDRVIEQTGQITQGMLDVMQQQILQLNTSATTISNSQNVLSDNNQQLLLEDRMPSLKH